MKKLFLGPKILQKPRYTIQKNSFCEMLKPNSIIIGKIRGNHYD